MKHHQFVLLDNSLRSAWFSNARFPLSAGQQVSANKKPVVGRQIHLF